MSKNRVRLPIITKREEMPAGYVRLATYLEPGGRQGFNYSRLRRAVDQGEVAALKFYAAGLDSKCAPTYVSFEAAEAYLDRCKVEARPDQGPLFRDNPKPLSAGLAGPDAIDALAATLAPPTDPGGRDRLAASLERIAEALETLTTGARLELALEDVAS